MRAVCLAVVWLSAASAAAGRLTVSAWLPTNWDYDNGLASLKAGADSLTSISPVWYWVKPDGGVSARLPGGQRGECVGACETEIREFCRTRRITILPLISNSSPGKGFDADLVSRILNTPALRAAHMHALVTLVDAHGYDGIEVDYELMKGSDRNAFTGFMRDLAAALHARGKMLAAAIHPKLTEPGDDWGPMAQDYAALGRIVDSFRVMTYDHHWQTGPAGPLAPLPWFKDVLRFTVSLVPRDKISMGIPTYGYDWTGSRTGKSRDVTPRDAPALAKKKGVTVEWDEMANEPHFRYLENSDEHIVWYEDAECLPAKLQAVRDAGLAGIAIWRLGSEEPAFWEKVKAVR